MYSCEDEYLAAMEADDYARGKAEQEEAEYEEEQARIKEDEEIEQIKFNIDKKEE